MGLILLRQDADRRKPGRPVTMRAKNPHTHRPIQELLPAIEGCIVLIRALVVMTGTILTGTEPRQSLEIDAENIKVCDPFSGVQDRDHRFHKISFLVYRPSLYALDLERQRPVGEAEV